MLNQDNAETRQFVEDCYRTTSTLINPIIDWSDDDVWQFLKHYGCQANPLYQCGSKRIGCIGCPLGGYKAQKKELAQYPKYRAAYVRAFDKMLKRRQERGLLSYTNFWTDAESVMRWWVGDDPFQITIDDYLRFKEEEAETMSEYVWEEHNT